MGRGRFSYGYKTASKKTYKAGAAAKTAALPAFRIVPMRGDGFSVIDRLGKLVAHGFDDEVEAQGWIKDQ